VFAIEKTKYVVLDDYGMSFAINTGVWLASIDCLNTWIIDEICNRKCGIRRLGQDHLYAIIERVRYNIPLRHKSPCEIRTYKPTSWWTRLLTCSKSYTTFLYYF